MLLGMTALTWVILIPAVGCWPAAGYLVYRINRSGKRHEEHAEHERAELMAAHAPAADAPGVAAGGSSEPHTPGV